MLCRVVLARHLDFAGGGELCFTLDPGDLVLFEQKLHAFGVGAHHLALARLHARQVQLHLAHGNAVVLQRMLSLMEILRGLQQRLGGNAADIQACPAQRLTLLDARHLQPQLRRANGADITARARADYDNVKGFGHIPMLQAG